MPDTSDVIAERRAGEDRRHGSRFRIAAVGDFHCGEADVGAYRELFARANEQADVLLLAGDLTQRGKESEFRVVVGELADVKIPVVAVMGNHDYEAGQVSEGTAILRGRGVHVLCGESVQITEQVGVAGVKGFMGGFGRGTLTPFGEPEAKTFVSTAMEQVHCLEMAMRRLATPVRVVLLHYAPVLGTVLGEPEFDHPFLGTDRLAEPLDRYQAAVAFHGHVHSGAFRGQTPGGVPVFNVSLPLLRREKIGPMFYVHELAVAGPASPR